MANAIIIFGAGGHARVAAETAREAGYTVKAFVDPGQEADFDGIQTLKQDNDPLVAETGQGLVAIGSIPDRQKVVQNILKLMPDFKFISIVHPSAVIARGVTLGRGSLIVAGAVINTGAAIGDHAIINTRAGVDHDCRVGDYSHLGPGATLSGGVTVDRACLLGSGAIVLPGLTLEAESTLGAGAVLTSNLATGKTALGNPARVQA